MFILDYDESGLGGIIYLIDEYDSVCILLYSSWFINLQEEELNEQAKKAKEDENEKLPISMFGKISSFFKGIGKKKNKDLETVDINEVKVSSDVKSRKILSRKLASKKSYLNSLRSRSIFTESSNMTQEINNIENLNKERFKKYVNEKGKYSGWQRSCTRLWGKVVVGGVYFGSNQK